MKTADEIVNKEFSHSFMGYDMQEVDFFLDELIERFDKLDAERKEMLSAMEYLLKKVEALGGLTENGDRKRLAAAESTFTRLRGAAAQSIPAGPVRVQQGKPRRENQLREKERPERVPREAAKPAPAAAEPIPVAEELETGAWAPDLDTIVPDLMDAVEPLLADVASDPAESYEAKVIPEDDSKCAPAAETGSDAPAV